MRISDWSSDVCSSDLVARRRVGQPRHEHDLLDAWQLADQFAQCRAAIEILATVPIAIGEQQQLRTDLAEAVEHGGYPEIGRATRPYRADADAGEKADHRFRRIRQPSTDTIARS